MYVKPEARRKISIPDNYGGNAFSEPRGNVRAEELPIPVQEPEPTSETVETAKREEKKGSLFSGIGSEELLLLGMILILSQSDEGSDILPFLLMLLFFKGGK